MMSEQKATLLIRAPEELPQKKEPSTPPLPPLVNGAAGQTCAPTTKLRFFGRLVTKDGELTQEYHNNSRATWAWIRKFSPELFS